MWKLLYLDLKNLSQYTSFYTNCLSNVFKIDNNFSLINVPVTTFTNGHFRVFVFNMLFQVNFCLNLFSWKYSRTYGSQCNMDYDACMHPEENIVKAYCGKCGQRYKKCKVEFG